MKRAFMAWAAIAYGCAPVPAREAGGARELVVAPTIASARPHVAAPTTAAGAALEPAVSWSEDGKWIAWRSSADHFVVARTTDFAPVRTVANGFDVGFFGNWLYVSDGTDMLLEKPEDGTRIGSAFTPSAPSIVTRSSIVSFDPASPRMISRADGKQRPLALSKSCPPTDDLAAVTAAATMGDLLALDVECRTRGAPACTGARGNCESGSSSSVIVDAATGNVTKLAVSFWGDADVVAFAPDAQKLLVAGQSGTFASVLDAKTGRVLRRIDVLPPKSAWQGIGCAAWTPDSETVYLITVAGVLGFSARSGRRVASAEDPRFSASTLSCTAKIVDGFLVTMPDIETVLRFRVPQLDAPQDHVHPLDGAMPTFSADGRFVAFADRNGAALLDTRRWSATPVETSSTRTATFDPAGSFVALDRAVWDVRTLRRAATLRAKP